MKHRRINQETLIGPRTRIVKAVCSQQRFQEFYEALVKLCINVKVLFTKAIRLGQVRFELEVVY